MKGYISFSRPQIKEGYALGERTAIERPDKVYNVTEMLLASADDCDLLASHVIEWARDNIEYSEADFYALTEIIKGFRDVMKAAADFVDERATDSEETEQEAVPGKRYPLGNIAECLDALEAHGNKREARAAILDKLRTLTGVSELRRVYVSDWVIAAAKMSERAKQRTI